MDTTNPLDALPEADQLLIRLVHAVVNARARDVIQHPQFPKVTLYLVKKYSLETIGRISDYIQENSK